MSKPTIQIVKCFFDDCKKEIIGYRISESNCKLFLCESHYHMLELCYGESQMTKFGKVVDNGLDLDELHL